jgi:hypothetical protein
MAALQATVSSVPKRTGWLVAVTTAGAVRVTELALPTAAMVVMCAVTPVGPARLTMMAMPGVAPAKPPEALVRVVEEAVIVPSATILTSAFAPYLVTSKNQGGLRAVRLPDKTQLLDPVL